MKRKYIKGFTLVELIVVLAILAILAAMLVPSLTGYIDKAKKKKDIATARNILTAAQTISSELWATNHDKMCDAKRDGKCRVVIPLSNDIGSGADKVYGKPPEEDRILRYYTTYNLIEEAFNQEEKFYIAFLVEKSVVLEAVYYPDESDYCFKWTRDSQTWEELKYTTNLWDQMYKYCDSHSTTKPNWNGYNPGKYPNNKVVP